MDQITSDQVSSVERVEAGLVSAGYIPSRQICTALFLSIRLQKPILVEGPAGVGKTELAKATAQFLDLPLIRMQCYEGLDESKALYEWKYGKQLLYTQILRDKLADTFRDTDSLEAAMAKLGDTGELFFSEQFLEPRPLLRALQEPQGAVLLVDEIDKADEEFEAFLLEILSDYQVTIPELGPHKAVVPPIVLLTSNNTRDLGDAMKRRCLHLHIGYPEAKLEERIIATPRAGRACQLASPACQLRAAVARARSAQAALGQRNDRLGARAAADARQRPGTRVGARHAQRAAEIRGRHGLGRSQGRRAHAQGARRLIRPA